MKPPHLADRDKDPLVLPRLIWIYKHFVSLGLWVYLDSAVNSIEDKSGKTWEGGEQ